MKRNNIIATVLATAGLLAGVLLAIPPQPVGQTGSWNLVFEDNFDGTTLDLTKWAANWYKEGAIQNNVGTYAKNVSVADGNLILTLASASSGASVNTQSNNGFEVKPGMYTEARIMFPGNGSKLYNWPAWWISGTPWPQAGEHDIAEVLGGSLTVNYHSSSGSHNQGAVSGYWGDAYHVYGIYRDTKSAQVYWDGKLVKSYSTDDNGQGDDIILNIGASGAYPMFGEKSQVKIDYVRVWNGNGITATSTSQIITDTPTRTPTPISTVTNLPTFTPTWTATPTIVPTKVIVTPIPTCYPVEVGEKLIGDFCP